MYFQDFLTLAFAHFIALLSPGADFFIIIGNSSKYGKFPGILTACGIAIANLVYILFALFSINLIKDNEILFICIKFLGSFYLLYLSYQLIVAPKRKLFENNRKRKNKKLYLIYFFQGFLSAILNPKNSIFYFTMFSITTSEDTSFNIELFYGLWMFFAVLVWDIFIVYLVNHENIQKFMEKYSNKVEKISGLILIFIASIIFYNI